MLDNAPNDRTAWFAMLLLAGCSASVPQGTLSGKVTVENGSRAGIVVEIRGPTGAGAVTDSNGAFSASGLADGTYAVSATLPGAEVPTVGATVVIKNAKADAEATLAFKFAAPPAGGLAGKVTGGAATKTTVAISGPVSRGAVVMVDGSYAFDLLPDGHYLLTAASPDTVEGQQTVVVTVAGAIAAVPDLAFTAVGTFDVVVKTSAMTPAVGAKVAVLGQEQNGLTDATGRVTLRRVLAGMRAISATLDLGAATVSATIAQGANPDVSITLTDVPPPVGSVKGAVQFFSPQSATVISVGALVLPAPVNPDEQGNFTLSNVPVGTWEFYADAPGYPRLQLGTATVVAGKTATLPPARMTFYTRFPATANLGDSRIDVADTADVALMVDEVLPSTNNAYIVDTAHMTRRPVMTIQGTLGARAISPSGKWVVLSELTPGALYVIDTKTLSTRLATRGPLYNVGNGAKFSSDEKVILSLWSDGLHRYDLATGVDEVFPGAWVNFGDYALQNAAGTVLMVKSTGPAVTLFTNVTLMPIGTFPFALTDCVAGNCVARMLPRGATTPISLGPALQTSVWVLGNTLEFAIFSNGPVATGSQSLVNTATGAKVALPPGTGRFTTNGGITGQPSTRLAYFSTVAGITSLREEALPATGSAPVLATSPSFGTGAYLSGTRYLLNDTAPSRLIEVKAGVATPIPANNAIIYSAGGAAWVAPATSKVQLTVGDAPAIATTLTNSNIAVYQNQIAASETDGSGIVIYNGQSLRTLPAFQLTGGGLGKCYYGERPAAVPGGNLGLICFGDDVYHELLEPGIGAASQRNDSRPSTGAVFLAATENPGTAISVPCLGQLP